MKSAIEIKRIVILSLVMPNCRFGEVGETERGIVKLRSVWVFSVSGDVMDCVRAQRIGSVVDYDLNCSCNCRLAGGSMTFHCGIK
jgi:hypothetical protein